MKCKKCNIILSDNVVFCTNCGTEVEKKNKKNKKKVLIIIVILIILFVISLFLWMNKSSNKNYSSISSSELISYSYNKDDKIKFIDGKFSDKLINSLDDVYEALESIKDEIGFKDIKKELKFVREGKSEDITYYKFNQVYKGISVLYQNIVVSVAKDRKVLSYSGYFIPDINVDVTPKKTKEEIDEIIKNTLGENSTIISNDLNIYGSYNEQKLVYYACGYSNNDALQLIIDANTGEILSKSSAIYYLKTHSYTGTGIDDKVYTINLEEYDDFSNGTKKRYRFVDLDRKISINDYRKIGVEFGALVSLLPHDPFDVPVENGQIVSKSEDFIKDAITTMAQFETIYDYYKNVLNRNSYDNEGSKIIVNLGVTKETFNDESLNNAVWLTFTDQMYIGDWNGKSFSASLDVLAHEFTHGVVAYTAELANSPKDGNKNKPFETVALNEGYSDILGSLIEGKNWTIAENNEILRNIENPQEYKNARVKGGDFYYPDYYFNGRSLEKFLEDNNLDTLYDFDKGGAHINSTVVSHSAYLMEKKGAFKSKEEMAKVWYNSLFLLSSYSDFEDCALAVIKSAQNLGLSDNAVTKIIEAFYETKMLEVKEVKLNGVIKSGEELLNDVNIKILSLENGKEVRTIKSLENGEYNVNLPTGTYKLVFKKEGYKVFEKVILVKGNTNFNVNLASEKTNNKDITKELKCESNNCVNVTIYYFENNQNNKLGLESATYTIDKGTILDNNIIIDSVNKAFDMDLISTDGESFYIDFGIKTEFSWYYKGTDTKFNWNEPINKDIEIEMKLLNGIIDNNTINNIYDIFNK